MAGPSEYIYNRVSVFMSSMYCIAWLEGGEGVGFPARGRYPQGILGICQGEAPIHEPHRLR